MTAPERPIEPGQGWTKKFSVPVKELGGRSLAVDVHFHASSRLNLVEGEQ